MSEFPGISLQMIITAENAEYAELSIKNITSFFFALFANSAVNKKHILNVFDLNAVVS